jgi:murein DD-endopeptidase MepM/ murein hydrolase activator NlpD
MNKIPLSIKKTPFLNILTILIFCVLISFFYIFNARLVLGQVIDKNALERQIEAKNKELEAINRQLKEQQQKLIETQNQKKSLTNAIKQIDSNISQINLGIQSSKISIEKLNLQIEVLQQDILDTQKDILQKSNVVGEILSKIQQKENDNPLILFLKNKTLSEGILEVQSLYDLNSNLLISINELNNSKNRLEKILKETANIKQQKEIEYINLENKKEIASDLKRQKQQLLEQTKSQEKIYEKNISELQKQQMAIALEIEKIEATLRQQINYKNLPASVPGLLLLPVSNSFLTQKHGATNFAQKAYAGKWHNGIDLAAPIGTPIMAAADGIVVGVENQDRYCFKGAYGKYVAIRHYNGLTTIYAHMSLYIVKEGQQVKRGEIIGYVGQTGYATGPHLHFGVYDSETFYIGQSKTCGPKMPYGGDLDPLNYVIYS